MVSLFAYLIIGFELLTVIFALMTCIISSKRRFFGMVKFAIVVDAALASLVSSIMEHAVERTESS